MIHAKTKCENCFDLNIERVKKVLFSIDNYIEKYSNLIICISNWGYGCAKSVDDSKVDELLLFRMYLDGYLKSIRRGYTSDLDDVDVEKVIEAVMQIVSWDFDFIDNYNNIKVVDSNFNDWVIKHPNCVAYEDWEAEIYKKCETDFDFTITEKECSLLYDLTVTETPLCELKTVFEVIEKACELNVFDYRIEELKECNVSYDYILENVKCDTEYSASIHVNECELQTNFTVDLTECKIEYDFLVETQPECELEFNTYIVLLTSNLSTEVIAELVRLGVEFRYENNNVILLIKDVEYRLADLDLKLLSDNFDDKVISELFDVKYQNPSYNIENLITSYNNKHDIKIELND